MLTGKRYREVAPGTAFLVWENGLIKNAARMLAGGKSWFSDLIDLLFEQKRTEHSPRCKKKSLLVNRNLLGGDLELNGGFTFQLGGAT